MKANITISIATAILVLLTGCSKQPIGHSTADSHSHLFFFSEGESEERYHPSVTVYDAGNDDKLVPSFETGKADPLSICENDTQPCISESLEEGEKPTSTKPTQYPSNPWIPEPEASYQPPASTSSKPSNPPEQNPEPQPLPPPIPTPDPDPEPPQTKTICNTCGADITGNVPIHGTGHLLKDEPFSYQVE